MKTGEDFKFREKLIKVYRGKKILAIVPARGGSKGIKYKNIVKLKGIPLIAHTANLLKKIKLIDKSIVSTDSQKIFNISKDYGLNAPFLRPKYISGDFVADIKVLTHALNKIEKYENVLYDIILMIQPTSPFRRVSDVEVVIKKIINEKLDSVWSVSKIDSKNHPKKILKIDKESLKFYEKAGKKIIARQQLTPLYQRNGLVYAMTKECIISQKTIKGKKNGFIITERPVINIDNYHDLKLAELLLK